MTGKFGAVVDGGKAGRTPAPAKAEEGEGGGKHEGVERRLQPSRSFFFSLPRLAEHSAVRPLFDACSCFNEAAGMPPKTLLFFARAAPPKGAGHWCVRLAAICNLARGRSSCCLGVAYLLPALTGHCLLLAARG
ncbi:hypothetical protein CCMA1212_006684 [Trichoderma ghanense]|uniref:Uncharacterized protein n=1 Tax=Trichoderma ghanense TaxID=65468 RepID=A0ABY2GYZ5_9HYPO